MQLLLANQKTPNLPRKSKKRMISRKLRRNPSLPLKKKLQSLRIRTKAKRLNSLQSNLPKHQRPPPPLRIRRKQLKAKALQRTRRKAPRIILRRRRRPRKVTTRIAARTRKIRRKRRKPKKRNVKERNKSKRNASAISQDAVPGPDLHLVAVHTVDPSVSAVIRFVSRLTKAAWLVCTRFASSKSTSV